MPMAERNLVQAIREALLEEMERDPRVCVLGEDVGRKGGVFKATEGLQQRFGEDRVLDTPLAESSIAGVAQGLALEDYRPVAEMQFADYSYPAFNQIVNEIARVRYRSNGDFSCPLVIRAPTGGGVRGALYHSQSPEAFYCHVPGLKVVLPSTPADAKGLLKAAIRDPDPVIFLEPKKLYRGARQELPEGEAALLPLGVAIGSTWRSSICAPCGHGTSRPACDRWKRRAGSPSSTRPIEQADLVPRSLLSSPSGVLRASMLRSRGSPVPMCRRCHSAPASNTRSC